MINSRLPAIWLIILIAGVPQLSETVYTPSLPAIAAAMHTSNTLTEYTLTIYLLGFAIGTLFWGKVSDKCGRKPCILIGLSIFIIGCFGCYFSESISMLMLSRFVQALGGSVGSVLGQAICRDAFHGTELNKAYASVGGALGLYPAVGPVIGGIIAQHLGWEYIFLFLIIVGVVLTPVVAWLLPETHPVAKRKLVSIKKVALLLAKDKHVIGSGLLVAACNGLNFSYFAEGSFYLIKLLGLSPSQFGFTFIAIALSMFSGGMVSKRLHNQYSPVLIMNYGLKILLLGSTYFLGIILLSIFVKMSNQFLILVVISSQMLTAFGSCMVFTNALAIALLNYKECIGTASSLLGFFYYSLVSLITLGMGALHNGTLFPMPIYFMAIGISMLFIRKMIVHDGSE